MKGRVGTKRSDFRWRDDTGHVWASKLESLVFEELSKDARIDVRRCEKGSSDTFSYVSPVRGGVCVGCGCKEIVQQRTYTPDLYIRRKARGIDDSGYYLEIRGRFTGPKRNLIRNFIKTGPGIDLRMLLERDRDDIGMRVCTVCEAELLVPRRQVCSDACEKIRKAKQWTPSQKKDWYYNRGGKEWYQQYKNVVPRGDYRSGLERSIGDYLKSEGIDFTYEAEKFTFTRPTKGICAKCASTKVVRSHTYTPDFHLLATGVRLEAKGYFNARSRGVLFRFKKSNPDVDLRIVFGNASTSIKGTKVCNWEWAEKNKYPWVDWDGQLPKDWLV
ncbi:MAG: hypothetical protein QQN63_09270 [Nitrosopumilus sp.]